MAKIEKMKPVALRDPQYMYVYLYLYMNDVGTKGLGLYVLLRECRHKTSKSRDWREHVM